MKGLNLNDPKIQNTLHNLARTIIMIILAIGALIGVKLGHPFSIFLLIGVIMLWFRTWYGTKE